MAKLTSAGSTGFAVFLGGSLLAAWAWAQVDQGFDPADPFSGVSSGAEWVASFETEGAVDADDPFHNLNSGEWWRNTWGGQWMTAAANGITFEAFYDTLQGNSGTSVVIRSPYPYASAEEHWGAWLEAAGGGTAHTRATLPDWAGDWTGGAELVLGGSALVRDVWDAVSEDYRPRFEQILQSELEGRHWWPADGCLPNGFTRSGWSTRYFMMDPGLVLLAKDTPVTEARYVFTDDRGFLPPGRAVPQWNGESQGFWDGGELVVWTTNIIPWNGSHGQPEHSGRLEIIERWAMIGGEIVTDITLYDPEAFAYPWHDVATFQRRVGLDGWLDQPPTLNECVSTNNVHHDELGRIDDFGPDDPRHRDIFDSRPWATVFERAETAKAQGLLPAAPSFLGSGSTLR